MQRPPHRRRPAPRARRRRLQRAVATSSGSPDDVHGRFLSVVVDPMSPSDQRSVRAAKEPGRRSRRVATCPSPLSASTSASRSSTGGCRSRAATRAGSPSASARRSRSSPRISCAATRGASRARWRPPGRRATTRVLPSIKANYTLARALRAHAGGPRLRRLRAGGAARRAGRRRAAAADLRQRHGQDARAARAGRRHRRAHHARQRPRDRARARRRARARPPRRRCASACARATSSCRQRSDFSEGSVYATAQEYKPGHPDRRADRGGPRGRRSARARRARPDVAPRPAPQRPRDLARVRGQRRRDRRPSSRGAWDGWQPRELDLGGGYAAPRDPNTLGLRRRHRRSRWRRPSRTSSRRSRAACARASPDACRWPAWRSRSSRAARCTPTRASISRASSISSGSASRSRGAGSRPTRPRCSCSTCSSSTAAFPSSSATRMSASPRRARSTSSAAPAASTCSRGRCACPQRSIGDTLAFLDTGAYEDACAANFNALPRPAIVLVSGSDAEIVRRAETIEDVFARDVVPERLRP